MPTNKIQTGIRFSEEMLKKVTYIAKKKHRSMNAQLEYITQQCIEQFEKENGEIIIEKEE